MISTSMNLHPQWLRLFGVLKLGLIVLLIFGCMKQKGAVDQIIPDAGGAEAEDAQLVKRNSLAKNGPLASVIKSRDTAPKRPDLLAYAEPITPNTIRRFPHLEEFQGDLIIGNKFSQVIIPGVSTDSKKEQWHRLVIAVFDWEGQWQENRSIGTISILPPDISGQKMQLTAVNFKSLLSQEDAKIQLLFSANKHRRKFVELSMSNIDPKMQLMFLENNFMPSNAWPVQITEQQGDILFDAHVGKTGQHNRMSSYIDTSILTMFSYTPFVKESLPRKMILSPQSMKKKSSYGLQGYELWFGRASIEKVVLREEVLNRCKFDASKQSKTFERCAQNIATATLKINLSGIDQGQDEIAYPLHITASDYEPIAYIPLFSGASQTIRIPANKVYGFISSRFGKSIQEIKPVSLAKNEEKTLSIPPRLLSKLTISVENERIPGVVQFSNLDITRNGRSLLTTSKSGGAEIISANKVLVSTWPLVIDIIEGSYNINVYRKRGESLCDMNISIVANQISSMHCEELKTAEKEVADGVNVDLRDNSSGFMKDNIRKLQGKTWFAGKSNTLEDEIPMDAAKDANLGIELRWIGASGKQDLREVAKFKNNLEKYREKVAEVDGAVELGCPTPGMTAFEYQNLIEKLHPNFVRIFGCANVYDQENFLASVGTATANLNKRILISAAGNSSNYGSGLNYSFLRLFNDDDDTPQEVVKKLVAGEYSIANGAFVKLENIEWIDPKTLELSLNVTLENQNSLDHIIVYSETGNAYPLTIDANVVNEGPFKLKAKWLASDKFLRAEARGTLGGEIKKSVVTPVIRTHLGTTNFVPVPEPKL